MLFSPRLGINFFAMHKLGVAFGLLVILLQNLVFWQALLPVSMQQNPVCVEIMQMTEHSVMYHDASHTTMSAVKSSAMSLHSDFKADHQHSMHPTLDCHFCHLFHHIAPTPTTDITLIEIGQVFKLIFLSAMAYILFCLRRLFLCPQGRAPPVNPVLI